MYKWKGMRCMGHVRRLGKMRKSYNILVGKPQLSRKLGRIILKWA
jgi:hypothetical protein